MNKRILLAVVLTVLMLAITGCSTKVNLEKAQLVIKKMDDNMGTIYVNYSPLDFKFKDSTGRPYAIVYIDKGLSKFTWTYIENIDDVLTTKSFNENVEIPSSCTVLLFENGYTISK